MHGGNTFATLKYSIGPLGRRASLWNKNILWGQQQYLHEDFAKLMQHSIQTQLVAQLCRVTKIAHLPSPPQEQISGTFSKNINCKRPNYYKHDKIDIQIKHWPQFNNMHLRPICETRSKQWQVNTSQGTLNCKWSHQINIGGCLAEDHEVRHSQWSCYWHKIFQHILVPHLVGRTGHILNQKIIFPCLGVFKQCVKAPKWLQISLEVCYFAKQNHVTSVN